MKKILFGLTCMAAFAACTDDYTDWATPQANEPEDPQTVEVTVGEVEPIDFATLVTTNDSVQIFAPAVKTTTAGVTEFKVVFSKEEYLDGEEYKTVEVTADANGYVHVNDLQATVETLYGKKPEARNLAMDITGYTNIGGVEIVNKATSVVNVTLAAPFIDEGYYLTGDFAGWNKDGALPFSHIGGGDVYDNPEFEIVFTTNGDNQYWKIISKTNYDGEDTFWNEGTTGVVGTVIDGDTSAEGNLTTTSPQAGKIPSAGMYKMTINMMNYTFKIEAVAPQFYMVGALPGWSADGAKTALLYPSSTTKMSYTSKFTGAWDLKLWNKNDLGNWDNCYGSIVDGDSSPSGTLISSGAQAISAPSAEFYTFSVDLAAMTYTWTKLSDQNPTEYTKMGIIGDFNGWSEDVELTQVTPHNWYLVTTVTDGGLKFRANSDWGINWGTSLTVTSTDFYGVGVKDGDNIYVPAGTYAFYINDITGELAIVAQ